MQLALSWPFVSPAYRRFAPIGGCPRTKQLDLFPPFASISSKRDLKVIAIGYFL
jgi:hypothetical protein